MLYQNLVASHRDQDIEINSSAKCNDTFRILVIPRFSEQQWDHCWFDFQAREQRTKIWGLGAWDWAPAPNVRRSSWLQTAATAEASGERRFSDALEQRRAAQATCCLLSAAGRYRRYRQQILREQSQHHGVIRTRKCGWVHLAPVGPAPTLW